MGLLAIAVAGAALFLTKSKGLQLQANAKPNDLGQGVAADSGLRGHLVTEWKEKAVHYKLKIEPIDARSDQGFAKAVGSAVQPIYINVRVLDSASQPVCGKQIAFAQGGAVANGADAFKAIAGTNRHIAALWAEGTLPCSPDQYGRFDYWDFTTNFPTIADQNRMLGLPTPVVAEQEMTAAPQRQAQAETAPQTQAGQPSHGAARKRVVKKPQSVFYLAGDDHVTAFDAVANVLTVGRARTLCWCAPEMRRRRRHGRTTLRWCTTPATSMGAACCGMGGGAAIPARANE